MCANGLCTDGYACVGRGTMTRIRRGPWWTVPFLLIGRLRHILVADTGTDVPFIIENYPYRDPLGRETVTFVREYRARTKPARFDATMVLDSDRGTIVDYLGTHQHLAVDLHRTERGLSLGGLAHGVRGAPDHRRGLRFGECALCLRGNGPVRRKEGESGDAAAAKNLQFLE